MLPVVQCWCIASELSVVRPEIASTGLWRCLCTVRAVSQVSVCVGACACACARVCVCSRWCSQSNYPKALDVWLDSLDVFLALHVCHALAYHCMHRHVSLCMLCAVNLLLGTQSCVCSSVGLMFIAVFIVLHWMYHNSILQRFLQFE